MNLILKFKNVQLKYSTYSFGIWSLSLLASVIMLFFMEFHIEQRPFTGFEFSNFMIYFIYSMLISIPVGCIFIVFTELLFSSPLNVQIGKIVLTLLMFIAVYLTLGSINDELGQYLFYEEIFWIYFLTTIFGIWYLEP